MKADPLTLGSLNPTFVAQQGYPLMTVLQRHKRPETTVAALATILTIYCCELGLDARAEMVRAERLIRDADGVMRPEFNAVRQFIKEG